MSERKNILLKCPSLINELKKLLSENLYNMYEFEDLKDMQKDPRPQMDYTFLDDPDDLDLAQGKVILLSPPRDYKESFKGQVEAVVWPKILEHKVGQTLLKRLLGENSSLGMESVYSDTEVDFKSFRFMDHLSTGYYSDVLAQAAHQHGHHPLKIRTFFDTVSCFFDSLDKKVALPYDVDFGVWKDVFVIQLHASCHDLYMSDILSSMSDYSLARPEQGLLKQAISQVDALDVFTLRRSEKIVLTAQWLHPDFKESGLSYPSLFVHEVPKFEELKSHLENSSVQIAQKSLSTKAAMDNEVYEQSIQNIQAMDFSELYQKVQGTPEDEGLDIQKVKSMFALEEDEALSRVKGAPEDQSEKSITVKGQREDLGESAKEKFTISEDNLSQKAEEIWKVKQSKMVDDIKDKQVVSGDDQEESGLLPNEEITEVVKDHLHLEDKEADFVVRDLLSSGPTTAESEKQTVHSLAGQLQEQELIKKDVQIEKMKNLMHRMRKELVEMSNRQEEDHQQEIQARQAKRDEQAKDRRIEALTKEIQRLKDAQHRVIDPKQEQAHGEFEELKHDNERLEKQLEVAKKRISQMSERMLNESRDSKDKEKNDVEKLKGRGDLAQKKIARLETDLARAQKKLSEKGSEVAPPAKAAETTHPQNKNTSNGVEGLKAKNKKLGLDIKKLEQKNRFLQVQLDSAQKKSGSMKGSGSGPAQGVDKRAKQYERVIEVMKENEVRAQEDLHEKKEQIQRLKAEGMSLKNKVSELERKLHKYEKNAA